jgi:6-hydroxycyclohex-1-ene-1-carbonyl-CoA dehydrogenase
MTDVSTTRVTRWQMTGVGAPLERIEVDIPAPAEGQALIRVAGCGVCHTDLGFYYDGVRTRIPLPLTLGHEISGVVEQAGPGSESLIGKAVVVPAVLPCGECEACRAGHGTICAGQIMPGNDDQGGFASHVLVPARGLACIDDPAATEGGKIADSGCTLAELSVVADAVTTPYQAIERARVGQGDLVVVIGLGGVGGFAAQIAAARGATVVGFDLDSERLAMLAQYGVSLGLDPRTDNPRALRKQVSAFAKEHGLARTRWKIFECSGSAAGQSLAWGLLVHGAYLSVVGYTMDSIEVRLSNLMAFDAKAAGNWGCLPELYAPALKLVLEGRVAVAPFVQCHPLSEIQSVFEAAHRHEYTRRPILLP